MTFQQREYGLGVLRSDLLKQVIDRERRHIFKSQENQKNWNCETPYGPIGIGYLDDALAVSSGASSRRYCRDNTADVQCSKIGYGVSKIRKPPLALKQRPNTEAESPPFRSFGGFNIGVSLLPITQKQLTSKSARSTGSVGSSFQLPSTPQTARSSATQSREPTTIAGTPPAYDNLNVEFEDHSYPNSLRSRSSKAVSGYSRDSLFKYPTPPPPRSFCTSSSRNESIHSNYSRLSVLPVSHFSVSQVDIS